MSSFGSVIHISVFFLIYKLVIFITISGTFDFFAFNYYTSRLVSRAAPGQVNDTNIFTGIAVLDASLGPFPNDTYSTSVVFSVSI